MNPLALFFPVIAGWVMAWGVFLGVAWATKPARAGHPITLFDDAITKSPQHPESMQ